MAIRWARRGIAARTGCGGICWAWQPETSRTRRTFWKYVLRGLNISSTQHLPCDETYQCYVHLLATDDSWFYHTIISSDGAHLQERSMNHRGRRFQREFAVKSISDDALEFIFRHRVQSSDLLHVSGCCGNISVLNHLSSRSPTNGYGPHECSVPARAHRRYADARRCRASFGHRCRLNRSRKYNPHPNGQPNIRTTLILVRPWCPHFGEVLARPSRYHAISSGTDVVQPPCRASPRMQFLVFRKPGCVEAQRMHVFSGSFPPRGTEPRLGLIEAEPLFPQRRHGRYLF